MAEAATEIGRAPAGNQRRIFAVACGAHALHDGYTDLLYVLLPLWQGEFGLGYAEIGMLRAIYTGAMAGFQVPAGLLSERIGGPLLLGIGTALSGVGYLVAGSSVGFAMLIAALAISGLGASVQHPIASNMVAQAYSGRRSRTALASYNFAGDVGKMVVPAATAWLVALMPWRPATLVLGSVALVAAAAILAMRGFVRGTPAPAAPAFAAAEPSTRAPAPRAMAPAGGFPLLLGIGVIDSATRMGFLTFLPFLLKLKGADLPTIGLALTLIFSGGAAGKLVCGWLGARLGIVASVFLTEGFTALGILALLPLSLDAGLVLLPLIGIALNGTSSVIYGTVPDLVGAARCQRAFGIFYTGTIGAGALAPVLYGLASDLASVPAMMTLIAAIVLITLPLAWALRPALRRIEAAD